MCGQTQHIVKGTVKDDAQRPISLVNILLKSDSTVGTTSDIKGYFEIRISNKHPTLTFSHVQYVTQEIKIKTDKSQPLTVILLDKNIILEDVEISTKKKEILFDFGTKISKQAALNLPSAFQDFNKILLTLPGVSGNNELSSAYNVRGGNFEENLVYVNDILVYRPFLSNAGRQEGLSFVNTNMVNNINFYAGGWEAKYGDKLSSSLNIEYKEPQSLEGNVSLGLLGGSAYLGNKLSKNMQYVIGIRHNDSRYLLNTLETKGQYFPLYTDIQSFYSYDLSGKSNQINRTKLQWLMSFARNRYRTLPESQITDFGSFFQQIRVQTSFEGSEELNYDTYQTGINFSHRWSNKVSSKWIFSKIYTTEQEYFNVEGSYRICDVNKNPEITSELNQCVIQRGIGTHFNYGRNRLIANLSNIKWQNQWFMSDNILLEAGAGMTSNQIEDEIKEYSFLDSAGFVTPQESIFNSLNLKTNTYTGYLQLLFSNKDSTHTLNVGARANYLDYNDELLISPRVIYQYNLSKLRNTMLRLSYGKYAQPPFYREFRDRSGNIKQGVKAQKSTHYIASVTHRFLYNKQPFLLTVEGYYKRLTDVIPYDIDNIRIRYFAENNALAFAYGIDVRIHGAFIKNTQSWFSLGLLNTQENIVGDNKDYIRRPNDQLINLAFYFEDHLPNDPSVRIYFNGVFGSGYPTGPPQNLEHRNTFSGDEYQRLDIGFSKSFQINNHSSLQNISIRAEILNALGTDNTLSYTWIKDVTGNQLAVPNALSARFINIRLIFNFAKNM